LRQKVNQLRHPGAKPAETKAERGRIWRTQSNATEAPKADGSRQQETQQAGRQGANPAGKIQTAGSVPDPIQLCPQETMATQAGTKARIRAVQATRLQSIRQKRQSKCNPVNLRQVIQAGSNAAVRQPRQRTAAGGNAKQARQPGAGKATAAPKRQAEPAEGRQAANQAVQRHP